MQFEIESKNAPFAAIYVYNEKVHRYIDEYCQYYGDKNLKNKIYDELENTETIGLLGCL